MNNKTLELFHHGIIGQKWGLRRFQPYPKSHTGDGKYIGSEKKQKKLVKELDKIGRKERKKGMYLYKKRRKIIEDPGIVNLVKNDVNLMKATQKYSDTIGTFSSPYKDVQSTRDKQIHHAEKLAKQILGSYSDVLIEDAMNSFDKGPAKRVLADILKTVSDEIIYKNNA